MVLAHRDFPLPAQLAYLGRKRAAFDAEKIGKRLAIERNVERKRIVADRLSVKICHQPFRCRAVREDRNLPAWSALVPVRKSTSPLERVFAFAPSRPISGSTSSAEIPLKSLHKSGRVVSFLVMHRFYQIFQLRCNSNISKMKKDVHYPPSGNNPE